jgi:hypothetical protein
MRGNGEAATLTGHVSVPYTIPSLSAKGESSLSEMSNSGTLLKSFYRAEPQFRQRLQRPSPALLIGIAPKARFVARATSGPSHYAAIPLMSSMELGRECEIQSRRFSQPSYSGPDARGVKAGDHRIDPKRKADDRSDRWACISTEERSRDVQGRHTGAATEASRKAKIPPAKIKLGHYRFANKLASNLIDTVNAMR